MFHSPLQCLLRANLAAVFIDTKMHNVAHSRTRRFTTLRIVQDQANICQGKAEALGLAHETQTLDMTDVKHPISIVRIAIRLEQSDTGVIAYDMRRHAGGRGHRGDCQ